MVTRTEQIVAAAATTEVSANREDQDRNGQKLIFCPPGVTVIRSRHSGAKHWSLKDGVPCCAPVGAAFKAENFDVAGTHGDRVCSRCLRAAERELGIVNARDFVTGVPA